MSVRPDWLNRYLAGERAQVWHELRQLGDRMRAPGLAEEAQAVCDEMAHRARRNIEMIIGRLDEQGYRFHENNDDQTPTEPFAPPGPEAETHLRWLEERLGPLPMTLSSWVRIVGDVWLVGTHPQWRNSADADPLVFEVEGTRHPAGGIREYAKEEIEYWQEDEQPGPFVLPVAPDHLHKANVSGGGPYGILLPDGCADAHFVGEVGMPLVDYLTWVFHNGGFPRPTNDNAQWDVLFQLRQELQPL
ncbi:hypothetical protein DPM19_11125 [Actinomadura craniellae]|uniref:Uncharacterized protein n=1 Tax=Actinomadura craniellae TaxID=2231787 RepID=A0A365H8H0_9ACTN|nr:hypothetical protein [Actinomadura craniellae]RAY15256.1 hypothetical protein DPM19_11125 [Actinomadura craniellae]